MKLTPKQQKFADEYIKTGNATQSAIEAGYSKKTAQVIGAENLSKPMVKSYIEERMAEIASKRVMSYTEAVELLTSIARGELMETVVVGTMDGVETVEKEADIKTRIAALKEILKRYPGNDKIVEQQVRKLTADADMAEARVRLMNDDRVSSDAKIVIVDSWGDEDATND
ncbi:terminase small subunit [Leuconostoc lactis]|uniref:terminase small subunit n=1 Tax=Leuconostoc lactis TaxID=1246 RepID=UPI001D1284A4|nr:terminase small subunit [Leuconostoc lactis]MCC2745031.1 terminase small subunit [Leuconostoc lactis]MCC2755569.1 terminase small subunit [Leuconostoc lactis]